MLFNSLIAFAAIGIRTREFAMDACPLDDKIDLVESRMCWINSLYFRMILIERFGRKFFVRDFHTIRKLSAIST